MSSEHNSDDLNTAGADESGSIGESHEPETHLIPLIPLIFQAIQGKRAALRFLATTIPPATAHEFAITFM
jgi:hypothetical protein